jgi:hypothetical protein
MNILILGCSFGVDNGEPHTETFLRDLGHNVYNCSQNGGSNINSFNRAKLFLSGEPIPHPRTFAGTNTFSEPSQNKNTPLTIQPCLPISRIDWIIWFHTELIRDSCELKRPIENTAHVVYRNFSKLASQINSKTAIIGGAGPILPLLHEYITPDYCIPSWFNKILKLNVPQIQTLSRPDIIKEMNSIGLEEKIKILDRHLEIKKLLEESPDFPDNYHPGAGPHKELVEDLKHFLRD